MSSINAKVPPLRLSAVDTPSDGEIPSYQSSSGDFEWVADVAGMTSFKVAGDTGATQTISDGNTLTIKNATGGAIKTVGVATDELTIDLTVSGVTAASYTSTDLTVDAQGRVTAASSGSGGGSFNAEITSADDINSTYSLNRVDATPPFGINTGNNGQPSRDEPMFYPFIAPETSTVDGIVINISSGAGSACNAVVAIYSDNNGVPNTKLGSDAIFDATVTGQVEQTSVGTISLTRGSQFWIGITRSAAVSFTWMCGGTTTAWFGPTENLSSTWYLLWIPSGSNNVLPATVTATDLEPRGFARISVGLNQ
mgnify:CR=1 FL=1